VQSSFDLEVTSKSRKSVKMASRPCRDANVDRSLPVTMVMASAVTARKFKVSMMTELPTQVESRKSFYMCFTNNLLPRKY
jgi:hypothetical protein